MSTISLMTFSRRMPPPFQTAPPSPAALPLNVDPLIVTLPEEFASFQTAPPCAVMSLPLELNTQPSMLSATDAQLWEIAPP